MLRSLRRLSLLALLLLPTPLLASTVSDLYAAGVPVSSQSDQARADALHKALAQVIVKVTGSRAAPDDAQVSAIISHPRQYLQAYRYQRHVPQANESAFGAGSAAILDLWAQFDRQALDQALRQAGEPIWGGERPATAVWIAFEQNGQRQIVSAETGGDVLTSVQQAAQARGLPVIFPLMDIEDQSHVNFSDIWGGFADPVVQASQRYHPDAVLIGRIDASGVDPAHWVLVSGGQTTEWDGVSGTPAQVADAAIQHLGDVYAATFVIKTGAQTIPALQVVVSGVNNLEAYGKVLGYLHALSAVEAVEPTRIAGDTVTFTVTAQGTVTDLKQTIGLGAMLKIDDTAAMTQPAVASAGTAPAPVLHYQYQP